MTNREKFKDVFGKDIKWSNAIEPQILALKSAHIDGIDCMEEWLNAEYKESTTKKDLPHCQHTDAEIAKSFIEDVEAVKDQLPCGEQMDFPNTFDEFAKDYGFRDKKEIYTNGSELIPVFRVKQWLEHISTTKNNFGVDAVSRKDVHDMLENLPVTVEDKWFNWLQKACMRLAELPSVTPNDTGLLFDKEWWNAPYEEVIEAVSENPTGSIEIKVGDEVTVAGANGIVVREPYPIGSDNELFVLIWYGQHMSSNSLKNVAPTGRHFPQITEVLEQLRRSCC